MSPSLTYITFHPITEFTATCIWIPSTDVEARKQQFVCLSELSIKLCKKQKLTTELNTLLLINYEADNLGTVNTQAASGSLFDL